jgi:fatty-acyl-CoA synthase
MASLQSPTAPTAPPAPPHFAHWPPGLPRQLSLPQTHLFYNAEVAAQRYPHKPFVIFYDTPLSFAQFRHDAERIAGWLQQVAQVKPGDRVLLDMHNSPQWLLAYYGILRADAVVVPINPMNRTEELRHLVVDTGASVAFVAQELLPLMQPLMQPLLQPLMQPLMAPPEPDSPGLRHLVVATYSDWLRAPTDLVVPDFIAAPRVAFEGEGLIAWQDLIRAQLEPGPVRAGPDDLAVMPYTSGTTGQPKGCMHTHRSVMCTAVTSAQWLNRTQDAVALSVLPLFHVTGMVGGMNSLLFCGATSVLLPRWDRDAAAQCMARYRITTWQATTTMVIDFLANPRLGDHDLSSLVSIRGGGAAMPPAVAEKLKQHTGLDFIEGYGLTETMAGACVNPPHRPKPQCLGIPTFDVDARIVDPATLRELPQGEAGEIVLHGPQLMQGYWRQAQATRDAFIELDGKRFLRTGDLGRVDEEGYFFMTDRLKRMINAAGFKVWPAEVEAQMYRHPAIEEVCIIGARDARRGETVKALVVLRAEHRGRVSGQEIVDWARAQMAAYKIPRQVEFVDALPKSGSGKLMWRELQEQQAARDRAAEAEAAKAGDGRGGPAPHEPSHT